jgi:hypothetical protein
MRFNLEMAHNGKVLALGSPALSSDFDFGNIISALMKKGEIPCQ